MLRSEEVEWFTEVWSLVNIDTKKQHQLWTVEAKKCSLIMNWLTQVYRMMVEVEKKKEKTLEE